MAFEQIKEYLDHKEIRYHTNESEEKLIFSTNTEIQQWFVFSVEPKANAVQFRSYQILNETDLKHYHDPSKKEHKMKLYEYLLECNYQWRFGKFVLDPKDKEVDLCFVINEHIEADKGIEKNFLASVWYIFMGRFGRNKVEEAILNIKSILATGEKLPEVSTEDNLDKFFRDH